MGATESKLTAGYTVQTTWDQKGASAFTVQRAATKANNSPVTVFSYKSPSAQDAGAVDNAKILGKAVQRLKTIRHPGIIKFIKAQADDKGVCIVTEPVTPLAEVLATLPAEEICMGLFNVIKTMDFLHNEELSHNNLQLSSIFVTDNDRRWVLGGMEFVTDFDESVTELLPKMHQYLSPEAIPPEDAGPADEGTQPDSRDAFALGKLITHCIKRFLEASTTGSHLSNGFDWFELQVLADNLSTASPETRLRVVDVLRAPWFSNNVLINVVENFLKEVRGVHPEIKRLRFQQLPDELRSLSVPTLETYVLPLVLTAEFASEPGAEPFFEHLFTPRNGDRGILSTESYDEYVLPFIESTLRLRTYNTRLLMLSLFNCYFAELLHWDSTLLTSLIIPELTVGLEDVDDSIYLLSLCALTDATARLCLDKPTEKPAPPVRAGSASGDEHSMADDATTRPPLGGKSPSSDGRGSGALVQAEIPRAVRKKLSTSPTKLPPSDSARPVPTRNVSIGLVSGAADWSENRESSASPTRAKRHSVAIALAGSEKLPSGAGTVDGGEQQRYTPSILVENVLIPHTLSVCVQDSITPDQMWMVLDAMVSLWKRMCIAEGTNKASSDVRILTTSIVKSFHLLLKALPPPMKTDFFCHRLVGDTSLPLESAAIHWLARTIDLGTPFVKDENRDVRQKISQTVVEVISIISAAMDRAPTIARKRDETSVASKLRKVYDRLVRNRTVFPRTGPRAAIPSQPSRASTYPAPSAASPQRFTAQPPRAPASLHSPTTSPATVSAADDPAPIDTWDDDQWPEDDVRDGTPLQQPREASSADLAKNHPFLTSQSSSLESVGPSSTDVPSIPDVPKPEEESEADREAKKEKLRLKREAREAAMREKRERKKQTSAAAVVIPSPIAFDGDSHQHTAETPGHSLTSVVTVATSPAIIPYAAPQLQQTEPIPPSPVEDYFKDMEPAIPPPKPLPIGDLAVIVPASSEILKDPPILTPTSSRLAMLEVVTDDTAGGGWGDEGLSDFE
ncbi:Protein-associating with the carboxyl-terminal domain of ezrin [Thoreauomyces humboldtii]|nr:Protein-associating with the carboxyl-terminal domain of ezrin [Thoreauomyces humboldtii]